MKKKEFAVGETFQLGLFKLKGQKGTIVADVFLPKITS